VDFYAPRFVRIQSVVETADSAVVPARFDDGSPAVAVREYGKGRCVLVLTSADVSWTDLPKRGEIFVPLAHQVMRYLHRGDPSRQPEWVLVGQPLALPQQIGPAASVALDGASAEGRRLTEEEVRGGRIAPPSSPGVYAIMDGDGRVRRRAVVNPAPAESDLASVMAEEWRSLARRGGTSGEALAEAEERLARPTLGDRVIWRSFLIGALALMLAELWLADRITR
jgi:hypothetical protein